MIILFINVFIVIIILLTILFSNIILNICEIYFNMEPDAAKYMRT